MAYKWLKGNKTYSYTPKEFQCDFLSDIGKLPTSHKYGEKQKNDTISDDPCMPGSECFCLEDGSIWLLGIETDTWVKVGYKFGESSGNTGSSGSNITSYNQLTDVPLKNLVGNTSTPLILSNLSPGIYKILGNYSVTNNSKKYTTETSGDVFIISSGKILQMASTGITLSNINPDGSYEVNNYATKNDVSTEIIEQLNTGNLNSEIQNIINQKLSYATDVDIDNFF
ncbi:hypothetical protein C823_007682 [Eubacterium plexicaudatum ASF492]|uniref:Uncharacterized protein n=1 Tax=Eubacterium plexicaudatum ASF492 TaxID=1235802 RepID=N1ZZP6_9FIRM|nr:hypothetical protein C823_007682 [Eubacterium plexicaudatum ASF492]